MTIHAIFRWQNNVAHPISCSHNPEEIILQVTRYAKFLFTVGTLTVIFVYKKNQTGCYNRK